MPRTGQYDTGGCGQGQKGWPGSDHTGARAGRGVVHTLAHGRFEGIEITHYWKVHGGQADRGETNKTGDLAREILAIGPGNVGAPSKGQDPRAGSNQRMREES